jgi:hypothetical protein
VVAHATAHASQWHRTAGLLARLPATVTGDMLPPRLLDDLCLVADGGLRPGSYSLRVAVLWAPGSSDSRLIEALVATCLPGLGPVRDSGRAGPDSGVVRPGYPPGHHGTVRHVAWHLPLRIALESTGDGIPWLLIGVAAMAWDKIADQVDAWLRSGPTLPAHLAMLPAIAEAEPSPPGQSADRPRRLGFLNEYHGYHQADAVLRRLAALRELCALAGLRPGQLDDCPPALLRVPADEFTPCWMAAPFELRVLPVADPYVQDMSGWLTAGAIRAELAAAHAVLGVVSYEDVVLGQPSKPHLGHLGTWLRLAVAQVGPTRVTLAVDGVGRARSSSGNTGDWVRQQARARVSLSASLPPESIIPVNAGLAVEAASSGQAIEEAGPLVRRSRPRWAAEDWQASGLPLLLARAIDPLTADPAAEFAMATIRELGRACAAISERCVQIRDVRAPVMSAVQRRARLAAMAGGPVADRVAEALRSMPHSSEQAATPLHSGALKIDPGLR